MPRDITPIPITSPDTGPTPASLEGSVSKLFQKLGGAAPQEPEDPYANLDRVKLLERFKQAKEEGLDLRHVFERAWWRNLLYVLLRQWIYFDTKRGEWRDKRLQKWIPRPVTHKPRDVVIAIRAVFSAIKLGVIVRPNGRTTANIITANTADEMQPLIHEEHKMDLRIQTADFWTITTGNAFLKVWWDKRADESTMRTVTLDQCQNPECGAEIEPAKLGSPTMPVCPECGGTEFAPISKEVPVGKGCTDVCSPFEILLPAHASDFEEVRKIIRMRWRPKDYWLPRYQEFFDSLGSSAPAWEKAPTERSLNLFKSLAAQSDISTLPYTTGSSTGTSKADGLTEYEYWEMPGDEYPEGLFFRVLGEQNPTILEDAEEGSPGPLPERDKDDRPLWTWIHIPYEPFGGRVWAMGALDPLIPKFDQLNRLDSRVELIIDRMANPIWLEPKGAEVERFTGEPGLVVKYTTIGPSGAKPERIPGEGPHQSLFAIREQILREIEEGAGTYDIMKGQKPTGVEAFSALQLLVERSQSRFTTAFNERGRAYRRWFQIALELERSYGPDERTFSLLGPNKTWTYQHFEKANLKGSISIVVEDGTNVPKTSLGKRAAIEQANQMQMLDPADPDQRMALYSAFGLQDLAPGLQSDMLSAHREQDAFEQWAASEENVVAYGNYQAQMATIQPQIDELQAAGGQVPPEVQSMLPQPPPVPLRRREFIDNDQIHFSENRKWANTDRMQELMASNPIIEQLVMQHLGEHQMGIAMLMAAQAGGPGAPGAPGGQGGGGRAMANSNQESGATDTLPRGNSEGNQGQGPA